MKFPWSKTRFSGLLALKFAFFNARCKKSSDRVGIRKKVCSIISDWKKRKNEKGNVPKLKVFQKTFQKPMKNRSKFFFFLIRLLAPYVALECKKPFVVSC